MRLHGRRGWGSVLIETQLAWYGLDHDFVDCGDLFEDPRARARLAPVNPISQVPVLVLDDGTVMTESAAITLLLADIAGSDSLVPAPGAPERPAFLRWLICYVANLYPVFTYCDGAARFVPDPAARDDFKARVAARGQEMQAAVEAAAQGPWFLGERFSALDLFATTFWHWEYPDTAWFRAHAPTLTAIAERTRAEPALAAIWRRNFPTV